MPDTAVRTFEARNRVTVTYVGVTYTGTITRVRDEYFEIEFDAGSVPSWAYTLDGVPNSYDVYIHGGMNVQHLTEEMRGSVSPDYYSPAVTQLTQELAEVRDALRIATNTHRQDISYMASALKEAAEENDLCNVFEQQIDNISQGLSREVRESFKEDASRELERNYRVSVTYTDVVTVTAHSEEEAQETVESDPGAYFDHYTGNFSVDEVEEDD